MSSIVLMVALTTGGMTPGHGIYYGGYVNYYGWGSWWSGACVPGCYGWAPLCPNYCPPAYPAFPAPQTQSPASGAKGGEQEGVAKALKDLNKALEDLKKRQGKARTEDAQREADALRQKAAERAIEDLQRALEELKAGKGAKIPVLPYPAKGANVPVLPRPEPLPELPPPKTATVQLQMPADAILHVNDKRIELKPEFWTPSTLEPGREYAYRFRVTVSRDGKSVTRYKTITVRAGAVVRLAFEDMTPLDARARR